VSFTTVYSLSLRDALPGYVCVCVGLAHFVWLCVRVHRLGSFYFLWEREQVCENVEWVNLCGVCLCLYASKIVGK
jgi:hypothetical protein